MTTLVDLLEDAAVDEVAVALRGAEQLTSALGALSESAQEDARRSVAAALQTVLKVDLGDLLVSAWRKHRELVAAARATRGQPDTVQYVRLVPHTVTARHEFGTEVYCGDVRLTTVTFVATLTADVDALSAVVRDAALAELQCGRCTFTVELTLDGRSLLKRSRDGDAVFVVELPAPVPLLDEAAAPEPQPA